MPNWACGNVIVSGKAKDVKGFCRLFVFSDDEGKDFNGKLFFARSFTHISWSDFEDVNFKELEEDKELEIDFEVEFAWSAHSCIMEGYPNTKLTAMDEDSLRDELIVYNLKNDGKIGDRCVTLEWACKFYNVEVRIDTEVFEEGFEEEIFADENGVRYTQKMFSTYQCGKCNERSSFPSGCILEEEECSNCGTLEGKWILIEKGEEVKE